MSTSFSQVINQNKIGQLIKYTLMYQSRNACILQKKYWENLLALVSCEISSIIKFITESNKIML